MAKVILTIEDMKDADGNPGLTVDWDGDSKEDGSNAIDVAAEFVAYILSKAEKSILLDKDGGPLPPTSTLN